jgi:hypothetical protein
MVVGFDAGAGEHNFLLKPLGFVRRLVLRTASTPRNGGATMAKSFFSTAVLEYAPPWFKFLDSGVCVGIDRGYSSDPRVLGIEKGLR